MYNYVFTKYLYTTYLTVNCCFQAPLTRNITLTFMKYVFFKCNVNMKYVSFNRRIFMYIENNDQRNNLI